MSEILYLELCESTQDEARKRFNQINSEHWVWVQATEQTQGRGRHGRLWHSKSGNLFLSCAFKWKLEEQKKPLVSLLGGLVVIESLYANIADKGNGLFIKWPNDIFIQLAGPKFLKLGGVLAESHGRNIVLGWGLNLVHAPDELNAADVQSALSLGKGLDAKEVANDLAARFEAEIINWQKSPDTYPKLMLSRCAQYMHPLWGRRGILHSRNSKMAAIAQDLDTESGALVVKDESGQQHLLSAGEFIFDEWTSATPAI